MRTLFPLLFLSLAFAAEELKLADVPDATRLAELQIPMTATLAAGCVKEERDALEAQGKNRVEAGKEVSARFDELQRRCACRHRSTLSAQLSEAESILRRNPSWRHKYLVVSSKGAQVHAFTASYDERRALLQGCGESTTIETFSSTQAPVLSELQRAIKLCRPFKESRPHAKVSHVTVTREVLGPTEKGCSYRELTPKFELKCNFSNDHRKALEESEAALEKFHSDGNVCKFTP